MSIRLRATFNFDYVGDGIGPMEVPGAQTLQLAVTNIIAPGANSPSGANLNTAVDSVGTAIKALITAGVVAQIDGFGTGGQ